MTNPLFNELVGYVMGQLSDQSVQHFTPLIRTLLQELHTSEDVGGLEWYDDLYKHWEQHISKEIIEQYISQFMQTVREHGPDELFPAAMAVRGALLLDSMPPLANRVESMYATFHIQWEDGLRVHYNCRPVQTGTPMDFDAQLITRLTHAFSEQFCEAVMTSGLDTFHDQNGKPFDQDKFQALMNIWHEHINGIPASEREEYMHIVGNVMQHFGPPPPMRVNTSEKPLEWVGQGGGFKS